MAIFLPVFVLLAYIALYAFALSIPIPFTKVDAHQGQQPLQDPFETWLKREEKIALDKLLANIAPGGENVADESLGVVDGTVVASPSREEPDYWYQWVRDAALTTSTLVDLYADNSSSELSSRLPAILDAYGSLQTTLQQTPNPSGSFDDLSGLGEPKFHVDGTPFTGSWGRPQRDGPALRAITLMRYLRAYNASHPESWRSRETDGSGWYQKYYAAALPPTSIIKADLEYVARYWNASGFDLWEEVHGLHFFTAMVQLRALREGVQLARAFDDEGAALWYEEQGRYLQNFIEGKFWNGRIGHLVATLHSQRSGLDCGVLLGSLHGLTEGDIGGKDVYPPWSDEVLVTLLAFVQDQQTRFPLNTARSIQETSTTEDRDDESEDASFASDLPFLTGTALGRYPEDRYNGLTTSPAGGNPWFLCTSTASHILYTTTTHLLSTSNLTISALSLPFYTSLLSTSSLSLTLQAGRSYGENDAVFHSVVERLRDLGDEFLGVVKRHVDEEGAMSEQFDGRTGFMRGARDLGWSYAAFLGAVRARRAALGE